MAGESKTTIVVDTREQEPYSFCSPTLQTIRRALPAGDYSIEGFETLIAVERKSLDDYVKTIINDKERFKRELLKLQMYRAACIVVEANLSDIKPGGYKSGAHPNSIFGATTSIVTDYNIPVYFCSDRQIARRFTEEWLLRWNLKLQRQQEK
jgi:DNA excision repair protein ERCC-4